MRRSIGLLCLSLSVCFSAFSQDSVVFSGNKVRVVFHPATGKVDYRFASGAQLLGTMVYLRELRLGYLSTDQYKTHTWHVEHFADSTRIILRHTAPNFPVLEQTIILLKDRPVVLLALKAHGNGILETRDISPLAILPGQGGSLSIPGAAPRLLDVPFDNDDWVNDVEVSWPGGGAQPAKGVSYELASIYDNASMSGIVLGSLTHDFWKTGIAYSAASEPGALDALSVFGGAATWDDRSLPKDSGGMDGTHDLALHGTMRGQTVSSPLVYLSGEKDVRKAFMGFGEMNARLNGRLSWKGNAPVYWNSFGVEGVLGYEHVMMPPGVDSISDFLDSLKAFNQYAQPVLSIDSYDQGVYTTAVLDSISQYGARHNQQMGFYFIPFAEWTWKSSIDNGTTFHGTPTLLRDVVLRDKDGKCIQYKTGDFGAYALDPTHPAVRAAIIQTLEKAKAIHARFLKIDFLTAGALESTTRYDTSVRTGMQAYSFGMKMLKHLIDSVLGPDIFITQAISPMFPNQYAHTRFVSTDVYSHLRNDQPGFPDWGSTEASLAIGSHMWWEQGTLWPFTNLDVIIMKHFQRNPTLTEREVRVRLYAMMVMGSILGDGSDFRESLARDRARVFLDNPRVCAWFSHPEAFTPLKWADGKGMDQQLVFYRRREPGKEGMLAQFNFDTKNVFTETYDLRDLGIAPGRYKLMDFLTDKVIGHIGDGQSSFSLDAPQGDAVLVRIVPE